MRAAFWTALKWLDCWVTDKWTGRGWEYYSAVLGRKQTSGTIRNRIWQWHIANILDWIETNHCQKALTAVPPRRDLI